MPRSQARAALVWRVVYGQVVESPCRTGSRVGPWARAAWKSDQGCSSYAPMGLTHVGWSTPLNIALCISRGGAVFKFNFAFFFPVDYCLNGGVGETPTKSDGRPGVVPRA